MIVRSIALPSSRRARQAWIAVILGLSAVSTLAGTALLFTFNQTAGAVGTTPLLWPSSSSIAPPAFPSLLVFVHPYCSCSVASINEIAHLKAPANTRLAITVLFYRPKNSRWQPGSLWKQVEKELPGARPVWDDGGAEAKRFGAVTSGYTLLYSPGGQLLFRGGVTGSRGHEGDNLGLDTLRAALDTGTPGRPLQGRLPALRHSLVFGCALTGDETNGGIE